jgi:hypothetical protein
MIISMLYLNLFVPASVLLSGELSVVRLPASLSLISCIDLFLNEHKASILLPNLAPCSYPGVPN